MRKESKMKKVRSGDPVFGDTFEHPSFGTISFVSAQGGDNTLFGSSIKHNNVIIMEICHAEYNRSVSQDWIFSKKPIVRAYMSYTQFAEAMTGMGSGSEAPITLIYTEQDGVIDTPDWVDKRKQFEEDFARITGDIFKHMDDTIAKAKEKKMPKWIIEELGVAKSWLKGNLPFLNKQFEKQMDDTVKEAKGEIEGYLANLTQKLGIKAIQEMGRKMLPPSKKKEGEK